MENLNKKDLEKVQGGYSGYDRYGYRNIKYPQIGDTYNWTGSKGGLIGMDGPGVSYKYTSEG